MKNINNTSDITIIGAGVTGTAIAIRTVEDWIDLGKEGTISIIEKTKSFGPGLPFNVDQPHTLRINDPFNASDIVLNKPEYSFFEWLKMQNEKGDADVKALGVGEFTLTDRFPPRAVYGRYCQWAFKKAVQKAIQHGISIDLQSEVEVEDMLKRGDGWQLYLSNHTCINSRDVVLATGHMPSDHYVSLENKPGFYAAPWQDLSAIPHDEAVVVLGSGLSAIDAAKKLHAQGHTGKIYFVSKSGALPSVKPPLHNQTVALKFMQRENVDKVGLTLADYLDLFQQELQLHVNKPVNYKEKLTTELPPEVWLEKHIALVEEGKLRTWQLLLDEIYFHSLPYAWKHLNDADKTTLMTTYFGPYLKWAAGTPLVNAKELLEMLKSGQLELISGIPEITTTAEGFHLQFKGTDIKSTTTKTVINGTGTGHNADRNSLLKTLRMRNILAKASQGGIQVDPQTYRVCQHKKERSPHNNLFAAGPAIFGSNPAVYAIEASAFAGRDISNTISSKPVQHHKPGFFHLNGKMPCNDTTNLHMGKITPVISG